MKCARKFLSNRMATFLEWFITQEVGSLDERESRGDIYEHESNFGPHSKWKEDISWIRLL